MLELLKSLSLMSGAAVMLAFSALLTWPLARVRSGGLRWLGIVAVPLILAVVLSSLPMWFGSEDAARYLAWRPLMATIWFFAGFVGAVFTCLILPKKGP